MKYYLKKLKEIKKKAKEINLWLLLNGYYKFKLN